MQKMFYPTPKAQTATVAVVDNKQQVIFTIQGITCEGSEEHVNNEISKYDLRYVLGLLNSKLLNYYFNSYKDEEGRAFAQVKTVDIKNLPFIEIESDEIIQIVEKILISKKQNPNIDVALYEAQIDKIVYSIYNLSSEEVELIEKTNSFKTLYS